MEEAIVAPQNFPQSGFYYHYKHWTNNPDQRVENYAYEVPGLGHHTEEDCRPEDSFMVTYRPLYEDALVYRMGKELGVPVTDIRPLPMFMEEVDKDGKTYHRFAPITEPPTIEKLTAIRDRMYPTNSTT